MELLLTVCAALLTLQAGSSGVARPARPDQIAFSSDRADKQYDIYIMNDHGTQVTNLTNHAGDDMKPVVAGREEDRVPVEPRRQL